MASKAPCGVKMVDDRIIAILIDRGGTQNFKARCARDGNGDERANASNGSPQNWGTAETGGTQAT